MLKRYNSASEYYKRTFNRRVQKISIDAGFTCPNRDGSKAKGGCTYCNNETFKPFYCSPKKSISQQLNEGIYFFAKKYQTQDYLAYFQAYSNTYAPLKYLKKLYSEALSVEGVIGLVIATRPDCVDEKILNYLTELSKKYYVLIEFGVESTRNKTLEDVNRQHNFEDSLKAVQMASERKLNIGLHIILGLPGEDEQMMLNHAIELSKLNFTLLKLHQLQIIKNTVMAYDFEKNPQNYNLFSAEKYIDFIVKFIEYLKPSIFIDRFTSEAPEELLIAPKWNRIKNFEIVHKIERKLEELNTIQGAKWSLIK